MKYSQFFIFLGITIAAIALCSIVYNMATVTETIDAGGKTISRRRFKRTGEAELLAKPKSE